MRIQIAVIALFAALSASQISAQSPDLPYARGIYFAGSGHISSVGGGFDGRTAFDAGGEILVVPRLETGFGAGGILGYRGANWGYEAGGFYKANNGSFAGSAFDTSTAGFTFDIEWLPFARTILQPYLAAGVGISTLTVKDGSSDGALVGDALYYVGGFRAGLGIEVCVTKQFFIRAQGLYKIERVASIQGVSDRRRIDLDHTLNADGYEFSLIIGYVVF